VVTKTSKDLKRAEVERIKDSVTGLQAAVAVFAEALENVGIDWEKLRPLIGGWTIYPPGQSASSALLAAAYDRCMQSGAGEPSDADNQDRLDLAEAWSTWKKEQR